jgi:dipeptidyl aminopeptidase/acylaminoacyl peptidase
MVVAAGSGDPHEDGVDRHPGGQGLLMVTDRRVVIREPKGWYAQSATRRAIVFLTLALAAIALAFVCRIAIHSFRDEYQDYLRTPPTAISLHPEQTGVPGLREISFAAAGDPTIAAWYAPSRNRAAVILVHGTEAERSTLLPEVRFLAESGFGVLAFDCPGQGASGGKTHWGVAERRAIGAAADWLIRRDEVDPNRIGAFGMSMGAYILTQEAVNDGRLRALVLAALPHDIAAFTRLATRRWGLLSELPAYLALRAGGTPLDMPPKDIIGAISPRPVLIVGGELDPFVPEWMARLMFAAARDPKELYIVPGGHHADYAQVAPKEYAAHVVDFYRRTLTAGPP